MNTERYAANFRERLKHARKRTGMNRNMLAEKMGCDPSTLHYLESGKNETPKFHILIKAALALNCSLDYLCGMRENVRTITNEKELYLVLMSKLNRADIFVYSVGIFTNRKMAVSVADNEEKNRGDKYTGYIIPINLDQYDRNLINWVDIKKND